MAAVLPPSEELSRPRAVQGEHEVRERAFDQRDCDWPCFFLVCGRAGSSGSAGRRSWRHRLRYHERVLQRRGRNRRPLPAEEHVRPARAGGAHRSPHAGRQPVPRRLAVGLQCLLRSVLGTSQADHSSRRSATTSTRPRGARGYFDYFNGAGNQSGPAGRARQGLLQLRHRRLAPDRAELGVRPHRQGAAAERVRGRVATGEVVAIRSRRSSELLHARVLAQPALQLRLSWQPTRDAAVLGGAPRGRGRRRAQRRRPPLRALRSPGPERQSRPRRHPRIRRRHRRRLLHALEQREGQQRGAPEQHLWGPRAHPSSDKLRVAVSSRGRARRSPTRAAVSVTAERPVSRSPRLRRKGSPAVAARSGAPPATTGWSGTSRKDVICGLGGNDTIRALGATTSSAAAPAGTASTAAAATTASMAAPATTCSTATAVATGWSAAEEETGSTGIGATTRSRPVTGRRGDRLSGGRGRDRARIDRARRRALGRAHLSR